MENQTSETPNPAPEQQQQPAPQNGNGQGMDKKTMAIIALIVNLFVPGVGTIIVGNTKRGVWQLVLTVVGWVLAIVIIGIFISLAAWIWALVDSIKYLQEVDKA